MKYGDLTIRQLVKLCRGNTCHNCPLVQECPVRYDFPEEISDKSLEQEIGINEEEN